MTKDEAIVWIKKTPKSFAKNNQRLLPWSVIMRTTANPYSSLIELSVVKSIGKTNTQLPTAFKEVFLSTPLKCRTWCSLLKATTSRPPHKTSIKSNLLWRISLASLRWIQRRHRSNLFKQRRTTIMALNWPQITSVLQTWWWTQTLDRCPAKMTTCFTQVTKTNSACTQAPCSTHSNLCSRTARQDSCHRTQAQQMTSALDLATVAFPTWPRCSSISNSISNNSSLECPCNSVMLVKTMDNKCSTATMTSTDLSVKVKMMELVAAATTSTKTLHESGISSAQSLFVHCKQEAKNQ